MESPLNVRVSLFPEGMPFRATRMWNELVKHLKDGIELKRKRWRMKYYINCFSGSEALAWVHEYLKNNPNYGRNVTRNQAQLLCQKLLQQNVLKDILPSCQIVGTIFEESRLYSFNDRKKSEIKENIRHCSTRKGTPGVKRKPSILVNRKPSILLNRKPLGTIINKKTEKLMKNKDNVIMFNNAVTKSVDKVTRSKLSRKWKSECNVSEKQKNGLKWLPPSKDKIELQVKKNLVKPSSSATTTRRTTSKTITTTSTSATTTRTSATTTSTSATTSSTSVDKIPQQEYNDDLWKDICLERLKYSLKVSSLNDMLDCNLLSWKNVKENVMSNSRLVLQTVPTWLVAAMKYLIHWPSNKELPGIGPDYIGFEKDVFKTISDYFQSESLIPRWFLEIFTKISGISTKCKLSAIRSLQHVLLLLETNKRQQLQLLMRFMIKVSRNHVLNLSNDLPTRELVIQTFAPFIFSGNQNAGLTDILGIRIASFIMDNYCEVFKVPCGLHYEVEQQICFLQQQQGNIKYQTDNVTFCQRITDEEYEEQRRFVTERSLEELLNNIVENSNDKERAKKLKQFEKTYPEIFYSRYPSDGLSMLSHKPERTFSHVIKPLGSIIKNLR